jgi:hypothetical protein
MKNRPVYKNTFGLWPNCHSQNQVLTPLWAQAA